ncbi:MAG: ornithine carbamoyltransferase [Chloroflexi bacterium]|nr:ornithine carbamoyltransferase [Chloroflexota bacterium]
MTTITKPKHFLSIADLTPEGLTTLLQRAAAFKAGRESTRLAGRTLALLFEKPSLRTRVSFHVAMRQLEGDCLYLSPEEVGLGKREAVRDIAAVLSRYVDALAVRTFAQENLDLLARYGSIPVINALTDDEHPCQALADVLTLWERRGGPRGLTLAYIGDANNCANSLLYATTMLGTSFRIASPVGYQLQPERLRKAQGYAARSGATVFLTEDPGEAVRGADAVYTDVWTSMGQEREQALRQEAFAGYQVTAALLAAAKPGAILLHPLPAHHGEEVAEGVLYLPASAVFDQAENRLHVQKAVLATLLEG